MVFVEPVLVRVLVRVLLRVGGVWRCVFGATVRLLVPLGIHVCIAVTRQLLVCLFRDAVSAVVGSGQGVLKVV